jgi:hypothetical protein
VKLIIADHVIIGISLVCPGLLGPRTLILAYFYILQVARKEFDMCVVIYKKLKIIYTCYSRSKI